MGAPAAEHARLGVLLDDIWDKIDRLSSQDPPITDTHVEQYAILVLAAGVDDDGDQTEYPTWSFETSRPHVQLGIVHAVRLRLEDKYQT